MEALVNNVYPTADLVTQDPTDPTDELICFRRKITDTRFLANTSITLTPEEPLTPDTDVLTYSLPKSVLPIFTAANEISISMGVCLEKKKTSESTWTAVLATDNVAPVNFLPDTMWEKVDVLLSDTMVSTSHTYRHIMAHLGRILSFNRTHFNSYMASEIGKKSIQPFVFSNLHHRVTLQNRQN